MKPIRTIVWMLMVLALAGGGELFGWTKPSVTKIAVITDVHHRDDVASVYWQVMPGDYHWRQFSTAEARLTAAVDDANAAGCDLFITLGDIVDGGEPDELDRLNECLTITNTFAGDVVSFTLGNHCYGLWGTDIDVFWGAIETNSNHAVRKRIYTESGQALGYAFDYNQYRFVSMYAQGNSGNISAEQLDWLYKGDGSGVLETPLKCIVMAHGVIYVDGIHDTQWYDSVGNPSAVIERFEAAGNVILVMSGHFHRNGIDGYDNQFVNTVNGITYLALRGSILSKTNGTEDNGTVEDSAHWVVEIEDDGDNLNIVITGYKMGESDSIVVAKPKGLVG